VGTDYKGQDGKEAVGLTRTHTKLFTCGRKACWSACIGVVCTDAAYQHSNIKNNITLMSMALATTLSPLPHRQSV